MPGIVYDAIDAYIHDLSNRGDAALQAVENQGRDENWPIVGPAEGSLLHVLARAIGARRILELGTAIGYSGTWLARALPPDGELVTVEWNPETAEIARRNLAKTGVAKRVRIEVGSALDIVPRLDGPFDLIFNDIDKQYYVDVLPLCIARLRVGGLLVTDNVLWSGEVVKRRRSKEAEVIHDYNRRLGADSRMAAVIVPLRDGVSIALKVSD
ncbi:MAG: O-methyltransferase [Methanobacteriota archaeon]|nr:MAG: O-methyltransferase [Euryarchaeota archaeon]